MKKTIVLNSFIIEDNKKFAIDVLYFSATSYSKSLYPTINREFKKKSIEFFGGGTYESMEENITETGKLENVMNNNVYFIKRTYFIKK